MSRPRRKLNEQGLDATILAQAGLRLGMSEHLTEVLDASWMYPAVGQGALGLECRCDDDATRAILALLNHMPTRWCVLAERQMLRGLGGGCQVPIGRGHAYRRRHADVAWRGAAAGWQSRTEAERNGPVEQAECSARKSLSNCAAWERRSC